MDWRCAAVRCACVCLMAASSAAYAADVSAAGAATANCVGPLRTIMRQLPALASRLAGWSGGSASEDVMVLSQPEAESAATPEMAAVRIDRRSEARTGCVSRLEVEGVEEAALQRGRLTYITPAHDPAHAEPDTQLPRRRQGVHDDSVQL